MLIPYTRFKELRYTKVQPRPKPSHHHQTNKFFCVHAIIKLMLWLTKTCCCDSSTYQYVM